MHYSNVAVSSRRVKIMPDAERVSAKSEEQNFTPKFRLLQCSMLSFKFRFLQCSMLSFTLCVFFFQAALSQYSSKSKHYFSYLCIAVS